MNKVSQHLLDNSMALDYFRDNLEGTNALCSALCKYVSFSKGRYYCFLPENVTKDQLYGFRWGGHGGGLRNHVVDILFEHVQNNTDLLCIFDDVNATYTPSYDWPLFSQIGAHFNDEVYYIASTIDASPDLLKDGFKASKATWHALCVLSTGKVSKREDRSLTESEITSFAKEAQMIVLGAYDGEGYVCWEKYTSS